MGEPNQVKWRGIRPVEPREAIPIQPYGDFGTQIAKHNWVEGGTSIIHTVTSGKNLYLCSVAFSIYPTVDGEGTFSIRDDNDIVQYILFQIQRQANDGTMVTLTFNPPFVIPEGWDIAIWSSATGFRLRGFIFGYEV